MLKVDYKNPYGYYTYTYGKSKLKIYLCKANAMWAEIYFCKNKEGKKTAQLYGFLDNFKHAQNCIKMGGTHIKSCNNYVIYAKELKDDGYEEDIWKTIRLLAENGRKVTIK